MAESKAKPKRKPNSGAKNLKPIRDTKRAKELGSKGGKAAAKKRAEKKSMQELAKTILGMALKAGDIEDVEYLSDIVKRDENGDEVIGANGKPVSKNLTVQQAALLAQANKAIKGDAQALAFLRDTAGEKPVEEVQVTTSLAAASAEIDDLIQAVREEESGDGG